MQNSNPDPLVSIITKQNSDFRKVRDTQNLNFFIIQIKKIIKKIILIIYIERECVRSWNTATTRHPINMDRTNFFLKFFVDSRSLFFANVAVSLKFLDVFHVNIVIL